MSPLYFFELFSSLGYYLLRTSSLKFKLTIPQFQVQTLEITPRKHVCSSLRLLHQTSTITMCSKAKGQYHSLCFIAQITKLTVLHTFLFSHYLAQIWSTFGSSQREFKIRAVSMSANDASNYIPKAPIFLPEGPWKQVIIFI